MVNWDRTQQEVPSLEMPTAAPLAGKRLPPTETAITAQLSSLPFCVTAEHVYWQIAFVNSIRAHLRALAETQWQDNIRTPDLRAVKYLALKAIPCRLSYAVLSRQHLCPTTGCPKLYLQPGRTACIAKKQAKKHRSFNLKQIVSPVVLISLHWRWQLEVSVIRGWRSTAIAKGCERGGLSLHKARGSPGRWAAEEVTCDTSGCQIHFHQSSHKSLVNQRLRHHCCKQHWVHLSVSAAVRRRNFPCFWMVRKAFSNCQIKTLAVASFSHLKMTPLSIINIIFNCFSTFPLHKITGFQFPLAWTPIAKHDSESYYTHLYIPRHLLREEKSNWIFHRADYKLC